jgi:hypothetical protein
MQGDPARALNANFGGRAASRPGKHASLRAFGGIVPKSAPLCPVHREPTQFIIHAAEPLAQRAPLIGLELLLPGRLGPAARSSAIKWIQRFASEHALNQDRSVPTECPLPAPTS